MSFFLFYIIIVPLFSFFDAVSHCIMPLNSPFSAKLPNLHQIQPTYFLIYLLNQAATANDDWLLLLVWSGLDFYWSLFYIFIFILQFFEDLTFAKASLLNLWPVFPKPIILQWSFVQFFIKATSYISAIIFWKCCLFLEFMILVFCYLQTERLKVTTFLELPVLHSYGEDGLYHEL